ncbi:MAG: 3-hydroxyacyl-CoA dehydrogenase NAD-binding domain-containing protein [Desulfobacterales bacterium]|nr:3-hydroxyacyl-CoA dehydrogenase NAD-binding domain-containing protein [Desulfobacterales bacterium]
MERNLKNVACVGCGLIGQGWAALFAAAGYRVAIYDSSDNVLKHAVERVRSNLERLEEINRISIGTAVGALEFVRTTPDLADALNVADFVMESVPDNYPVKKAVFKELDTLAPAGAILASSSSGLLMSEIQTVVSRPERCVLAHPFLPVHLLPLVEVVGGNRTAPATVEATCNLMEKIGKIPVRLNKEVSGYIVNRLQAALLREAINLVATGVASAEDVDRAFCNGMGMRDPFIGPLLRAHLAGNGISKFLDQYKESYRLRWESMASWDTIPSRAKEALIRSVAEMPIVRNHSLDDIKTWRDRMLAQILKLERDYS